MRSPRDVLFHEKAMIPAFVNPRAGSAADAERFIRADERFDLRRVEPNELSDAIRDAVDGGAGRVLVSGGDGTLATAAAALLGSDTEFAVLPGGTLNHFARGLGIPTECDAALELAATGTTRPVDVGTVNGRTFLNTSSVGTYAMLVRRREKLRPRLTYLGAGLVAGLGLFLELPVFHLEMEVEGRPESIRTPLVFFGVGERDMTLRRFGAPCAGGPSALHTIVVREKKRARILAAALATARSGIWPVAQTGSIDSYFTDHCILRLPKPSMTVAIDGEIVRMESPLNYQLRHAALKVVAPAPAAE